MRNRKGRGNCKNNSALLMLFVRKLCASTDLQKQQREKVPKEQMEPKLNSKFFTSMFSKWVRHR
ncbi:unnamed protein product [Brassica oleracea]